MSDMLNMDSLNCLSEVTEGDCKANSATATAGDSFRSIDYTEVVVVSNNLLVTQKIVVDRPL